MKCMQAQSLFSTYLDGAVTGREMRAIGEHLEACPACAAEYAGLQQTQRLVADLGRKKAPADLALKLRVALSSEASMSVRRRWEGLLVRLEDAVNGFLLPATAGLVSAVLMFGLLIGYFAVPPSVRAAPNKNDVPTLLYTPPQLAASQFTLNAVNDDSLVVETFVDENGRVQDYRILNAPHASEQLVREVDNFMIFTVFRPATAFGQPAPGRVVLSFSKVSVKG
ncbi:MAG TPA: anti-sigma factor [Terriglobales bacterium]|nr:anti-sigma factor [Terriglobales bacterium]